MSTLTFTPGVPTTKARSGVSSGGSCSEAEPPDSTAHAPQCVGSHRTLPLPNQLGPERCVCQIRDHHQVRDDSAAQKSGFLDMASDSCVARNSDAAEETLSHIEAVSEPADNCSGKCWHGLPDGLTSAGCLRALSAGQSLGAINGSKVLRVVPN